LYYRYSISIGIDLRFVLCIYIFFNYIITRGRTLQVWTDSLPHADYPVLLRILFD